MTHFNLVANSWDTEEKFKQSEFYAQRIRENLTNKNSVKILELGCGTGLLGGQFLNDKTSLLGIDTSTEMLKVFNEKFKHFNSTSLLLNLEENDLQESGFDLIISSMAFHHLKNPEAMMLKLKKYLKPQAAIAIIDLDKEDGSFHPDPANMGVFHFGFDQETNKNWATLIQANRFYREQVNVIAKNNKEYPICLSIFEF